MLHAGVDIQDLVVEPVLYTMQSFGRVLRGHISVHLLPKLFSLDRRLLEGMLKQILQTLTIDHQSASHDSQVCSSPSGDLGDVAISSFPSCCTGLAGAQQGYPIFWLTGREAGLSQSFMESPTSH